MRFYLLSDNVDTIVGMRLAGVSGEVIHEVDELKTSLNKAMDTPDIGVILITEKLVSLCRKQIYEMKLIRPRPLIVEIPDRHGNSKISDSISKYVHDAIGIKI